MAYLLEYAKTHASDSAFIAELEAALPKAPKYHCLWGPSAVEQEYLGDGRYGPVRIYRELGIRPDVVISLGGIGEDSCDVVSRAKVDASMLDSVRKNSKKVDDLVGIETYAKQDWEIWRTSSREPIRRTLIVKVYRQREF